MSELPNSQISQNIQDYFEAQLSQIVPDHFITFNIFLFFRRNMHIIIFRKNGDIPTQEFLDRYLKKGPAKIWIAKQERQKFEDYLRQTRGSSAGGAPIISTKTKSSSTERDYLKLHQEYSSALLDLLYSKDVPQPALIAKKARDLLKISIESVDLDQQVQANFMIRQVIKDVLDAHDFPLKSLASELWQMIKEDPTLTHAGNVSSYTVLFALAFGKTDRSLLEDLLLAGLLHDLGVTQISATLASSAWNSLDPVMQSRYEQHVEAGLEMINAFAENMPERVRFFIQHHHEKYNGKGIPPGMNGFKTDATVQFLALAEALDSIAAGQYDGIVRRYRDALDEILKLENNPTTGGAFVPGVLATLNQWLPPS